MNRNTTILSTFEITEDYNSLICEVSAENPPAHISLCGIVNGTKSGPDEQEHFGNLTLNYPGRVYVDVTAHCAFDLVARLGYHEGDADKAVVRYAETISLTHPQRFWASLRPGTCRVGIDR